MTYDHWTKEIGDQEEAKGRERPLKDAVKKTLNKNKFYCFPVRKKARLTKAKAAKRLAFAKRWVKKPDSFFKRQVLGLDEGHVRCYTGREGQEKAALGKKKHTICKRISKMRMHPVRVRGKTTGAHKQNLKSVPVMATVGNGKIRTWDYIKGSFTAEHWEAYVDNQIATDYENMKKETHKEIFVLRDGHPSTHNHEIGLEAEKRHKMKIIAQSTDTPEANPLDNSVRGAVEKEDLAYLQEQYRLHGPTWYETPAQRLERVRQIALNLPKDQVDACMIHTKHNLQKIIDAGGWYIEG